LTRRELHKLWVNQLKERTPCADCGELYPVESLDFDHVSGVKLGNISEMLHLKWEVLVREIEKCEVVCSSDHRIRTRDRRLDLQVDAADQEDVERELIDGA